MKLNKLHISCLLASAAAVLVSPASVAEETASSAQVARLDTVRVSATRSNISTADSPRSISVISADEIRDHIGSGGLQSLLEQLPGIEFARSGGLGGQLVMRGFNSNTGRTVLAIDGERYRGRSTLQFNMIDPESIERIEIIRGPASSLYGSDAMNGVINIVTRRADVDAGQDFTLAPKLRALQAESGSNMIGGRAELIGGGNGFDILVGAHKRKADDYETPVGTAENSDYDMQGIDLNIGYRPDELSRWELSGRYEDVTTGRAGGLGAAPGYPYIRVREEPIIERYLRLAYESSHAGVMADSFDAAVYRRDFETDIYNRNATSAAATAYAHIKVYSPTVWGGHLTAQKLIGDHALSYGGDFFHESFDGRTRQITRYDADGNLLAQTQWAPMERSSEELSVGVFVNDDWTLNDQWSLSGALRADYVGVKIGSALASETTEQQEAFDGNTDKSYSALTGSFGGVYRVTPTLHLVGNISRGFRAPSGMTMTITSVAGTVTTLPAPELEEETNITTELGMRWYGNNTELSVTAYESRYQDLISLVAVSDSLYQRQNISEATITGLEVDGRSHFGRHWSMNYALTSTHGTDDSSDEPLSYIAPLSGRASLRYDGMGWFGETAVRAYRGKYRIDDSEERRTDSYAIVNLYAGFGLDSLFGSNWQDWKIRTGIENLFDREGRNPVVSEDIDYSNDLVGNPLAEPGRSYMVKLTVDY